MSDTEWSEFVADHFTAAEQADYCILILMLEGRVIREDGI
jgi:hypothetical protein